MAVQPAGQIDAPPSQVPGVEKHLPDLKPARWIRYSSGRCPQNTFILFRRELTLRAKPQGFRNRLPGLIRASTAAEGRFIACLVVGQEPHR